ncbi:MAG: hypothetical protein PHU70_02030 [Dehalococcoidia bacterium]|nr:hypothetical protein [Dehalococcoidia bacterium]
MENLGFLAIPILLAWLVEALLEYVLGIWWAPLSDAVRPKVIMAAGLLVGVVLCICFEVDLLTQFGLPASIIGQILTGALVGRGAEYLHQFVNRLTPK